MSRIEFDGQLPSQTYPAPRAEWPNDPDAADMSADDLAEAAMPFLSPPPAPWPRVFPGL